MPKGRELEIFHCEGCHPMNWRETLKDLKSHPAFRKRLALGLGGFLACFILIRMALGPSLPALQATRGSVIQKVVASGIIVPRVRVSLGAQVNGSLAEVLVDEGELVKKDQLLARLHDDEPKALVEQARAAYEQAVARADQFQGVSARLAKEAFRQAEIRLEKARQTKNREEILSQNNATTQEALDLARNELSLAESQYQGAQVQARAAAPKGSDSRAALAAVEQSHGALAAAEAKARLFHLTAPMDAKVIQRRGEVGDSIAAGTALFMLGSVDELRVKVQVDEKYLSLVQVGQEAQVTADAYPGRAFAAKVERISPAVNQERGSVEVQLLIPESPPYLRYDMSATVEIVTNTTQDALSLPVEAIQALATDHPFVYVARGGAVEIQKLKLGLRGDAVIEITDGLKADDAVLLTKEPLTPGMRVRADQKGWPRAL